MKLSEHGQLVAIYMPQGKRANPDRANLMVSRNRDRRYCKSQSEALSRLVTPDFAMSVPKFAVIADIIRQWSL